MRKTHLTGIVALVVAAFVALAGAAAATGVITPPGQVVNVGVSDGGVAPAGPASWPDAPALAAASGSVIFSSDFNTDAAGWSGVSTEIGDAPAAWLTNKGKLVQNGDASGDWSDADAMYVAGDKTWTNYTLTGQVYATSGSPVGLVWRASSAGSYQVRLYQNLPNSAPKARLEMVQADGSITTLATAPVSVYAGYAPAAWQLIQVVTNGTTQTVFVDGKQLFSVVDKTLSAGQIGVYSTADGASAFDNIRVTTGNVQ